MCERINVKSIFSILFSVQQIIIGLLHGILGFQIAKILKKDFADFYTLHSCKLESVTFLLLITTWISGTMTLLYMFPVSHEHMHEYRFVYFFIFQTIVIDITAITQLTVLLFGYIR